MQLEADTVVNLLVPIRTIYSIGTFVCQFGQIVGLELDAVQLVVAAQLLDFLLALLTRQRILSVLVAGKLAEQVFLSELLPPFLFCAEILGNGEEGHDGIVVYAVYLYLVENLQCITESFRNISKDVVHLFAGLEPLLLRVEHTRRIVQVLRRSQTEQMVVSLSILLVHKVGIIGANEFNTILMGQLYEYLISLLLQGERLAIGTNGRVFHLMALQFQIIVVAKHTVIPFNGFAGTGNVTVKNLLGYLTGNTGRADDESLMVTFQVFAVGARTHIETISPRTRHQLDEVLVTLIVLGQHNEVVTALMFLVVTQQFGSIA